MIQMVLNIRKEFQNDVQSFADQNNIKFEFGELFSTVSGEANDIKRLTNFIHILEVKRTKYRNSKSFIWRLFNR